MVLELRHDGGQAGGLHSFGASDPEVLARLSEGDLAGIIGGERTPISRKYSVKQFLVFSPIRELKVVAPANQ